MFLSMRDVFGIIKKSSLRGGVESELDFSSEKHRNRSIG